MKTIHFSARFDNLKMYYHGEIETDNIDPLPEVRALLKQKCQQWQIDYKNVNELQVYWFQNNEVKMTFEWQK
jgi:hypothetical protein